jgi:rhamnosyltransferase
MRRAIVFAHFDRDGLVDPWVIRALQAYRPHCETLALVSASARECPRSAPVDHFLARSNVGYDFGSWRDGLQLLGDLRAFDEVVFVNDSSYGPLFDLAAMFDRAGRIRGAVWGGVVSRQIQPHLQSWLFAARRPLLESDRFVSFWESVRHHENKLDVVRSYELGFTRMAREGGFEVSGLYEDAADSAPTVRERVRNLDWREPFRSHRHIRRVRPCKRPLNPSEVYWDRLWEAGVPFLKAAIFRVNPFAVSKRRVLFDVRARFPEWEPLIRAHLARIHPGAL